MVKTILEWDLGDQGSNHHTTMEAHLADLGPDTFSQS